MMETPMAKSKKKSNAKAKKVGKAIETNAAETAHKIWLAGVGAYGRAYSEAVENAGNMNKKSVELFEDLVQRGEKIENDVRARFVADDRVAKAGEQVQKVMGSAREFQEQARERFETRMERMREVLGVKEMGTPANKLASKLDQLEDDVVGATGKALKKGNKMLKKRLARLAEELEAYAGDVASDEDAPKVKKKKAKKSKKSKAKAKSVKTVKATKTSKSKTAAKAKPTKAASKKADDLSMITGVGPALRKKLAAAGVTTFAQVSAMNKAAAEALDDKIGARGRIVRDGWVKQAKALAKG
jgi:predicted flap endonuclease-1-like 5' DNA nuclease